jgi:hypothetical protein
MKSNRQQLLEDVLEEAGSPVFKEVLWQQTLEQVRCLSRARRRNRVLLAVAVMAVAPLFPWRLIIPPTQVQPLPYGIVRSQALPAAMIAETKPGTIPVITSSSAAVAVVETGPAKDLFREIGDEQLLALLAGRPAALVRQGPGQASLLFLNPQDQNGFPAP